MIRSVVESRRYGGAVDALSFDDVQQQVHAVCSRLDRAVAVFDAGAERAAPEVDPVESVGRVLTFPLRVRPARGARGDYDVALLQAHHSPSHHEGVLSRGRFAIQDEKLRLAVIS